MTSRLINFTLFNTAWFLIVLSASRGWGILGPVIVIAWIIPFLAWKQQLRSEVGLLLSVAVLGLLCDSLLIRIGAIHIATGEHSGLLSPVWMVSLWVNLAATLRFSLGWLAGRYCVAGVLGGIVGPAAYSAGQALNALELPQGLVPIAVEWMIAMPLLVILEKTTRRKVDAGPSHNLDSRGQ